MSRVAFCILLALSLSSSLTAQQTTTTVQRDPQAIGVLSRSVNAAGGASQIAGLQDLKATGSISHFWGGEEVKGSATLRVRGVQQIRLDSDVPSGSRSWKVSRGATSLRKNGKEVGAPYQNGVDSGAMSYPFFIVLASLNDPQVSILAVQQAKVNERDALLIRTQKSFSSSDDPYGFLSKGTTKELLIDPNTYLPIAVRAKLHPPKGFSGEFVQEIQFEDFRSVNGVLLPFAMTETISGQKTWTFRADSIVLNTGLSDSDFDH